MKHRKLRIAWLVRLTSTNVIRCLRWLGHFGQVFYATDGGHADTVLWQLIGAVVGSLMGVVWELMLRQVAWPIGRVRFTLRTMLIATTLIAMARGVIIWTTK